MINMTPPGLVYTFLGYLLLTNVDCLEFVRQPQDLLVKFGDPARLECGASPPGAVVRWSKDGDALPDTSRRYLDPTGDLLLTRAQPSDAGDYSCTIVNITTGASFNSKSAHLSVTWVKEVEGVKILSKLPTLSGQNLSLSCEVEGSPPPAIQWFRNGDGLTTSGKVVARGRTLSVVGVSPLDNGVYRCLASNPAGVVRSSNTVVLSVPGDQWAQIMVVPQDTIAKEGSTARFDCVYNFADVIEWYFKQKGPLENTTHYTVLTNGSLILTDVEKEDEGLYSCVGIRGESTEIPQIFSAQLHLAYLKEADNTTLEPWDDEVRLVAEGSDVEIGCHGKGIPKPKVSWSKGGGHLLKIKSVSKANQGNYTCTISNLAGTTNASFKLVVTSRPSIEQDPYPVIVDEGRDALFHCEVSGYSKYTTIGWLKDGSPLRASSRILEKRGYLNLTQTSPLDEGEYTCVATTKPYPPVFSSPASLTVKEKLKFVPKPVNTHLELGVAKKLHCKAQGAAPPVVKWLKEGFPEGEFPSHIADINGTLHFNKVQADDNGRYTCIASNYQGIINATIDVDIVVSPKFTVLPQNPTYLSENNNLMLDCMAEGDPKPVIQWDKNSDTENFDKTRFQVLENGSLLILDAQLSDEGKYGCTAGNSGGFKRYEVSLIVRGTEGYRMGDGPAGDSSAVLSKTVAVTLGAAGAYMVLVIGLMAYCRCRSRRAKQVSLDHTDAVFSGDGGESGADRKTRNGDLISPTGGDPGDNTGTSRYSDLPVTRDQLSNMMVLGRGQFGEVCLAQVTPTEAVVMVKALQETRDEGVLTEFKRELELFGKVDHPNVAKLVGLSEEQHPHYMILQYTDWGDLKQMLLASRTDRKDKPKPPELTNYILVRIALQISLGMEAISNYRLVHKDLAARNCLVSSDLSVKVSLSALSKDVYRKEYFLHRNQLMPVRWMPYETVSEDQYTTKSDVFAYGTTLYEVFTRGSLPLEARSDQEVLSCLESHDIRLSLPESAPGQLQALLDKTRSRLPAERPVFSTLSLLLEDILKHLER